MIKTATKLSGNISIRVGGVEVRSFKNLFLDAGLNRVMTTHTLFECLRACVIGTGSTPVGSSDTALEVEARRTVAQFPQSISNFTYNNDTGMFEQRYQMQYTFPVEQNQVIYREVGFSHTTSAGANLSVRALIPSGLQLEHGQQAVIVYTITMIQDPFFDHATMPVTNWPVPPAMNTNGRFGMGSPQFSMFDSDGRVNRFGAFDFVTKLVPGLFLLGDAVITDYGFNPTILDSNTWPKAITSTVGQIAASSISHEPYVANTFKRIVNVHADRTLFESTQIRGVAFGTMLNRDNRDWSDGLIYIFNQQQTKELSRSLRLSFELSIARA